MELDELIFNNVVKYMTGIGHTPQSTAFDRGAYNRQGYIIIKSPALWCILLGKNVTTPVSNKIRREIETSNVGTYKVITTVDGHKPSTIITNLPGVRTYNGHQYFILCPLDKNLSHRLVDDGELKAPFIDTTTSQIKMGDAQLVWIGADTPENVGRVVEIIRINNNGHQRTYRVIIPGETI